MKPTQGQGDLMLKIRPCLKCSNNSQSQALIHCRLNLVLFKAPWTNSFIRLALWIDAVEKLLMNWPMTRLIYMLEFANNWWKIVNMPIIGRRIVNGMNCKWGYRNYFLILIRNHYLRSCQALESVVKVCFERNVMHVWLGRGVSLWACPKWSSCECWPLCLKTEACIWYIERQLPGIKDTLSYNMIINLHTLWKHKLEEPEGQEVLPKVHTLHH